MCACVPHNLAPNLNLLKNQYNLGHRKGFKYGWLDVFMEKGYVVWGVLILIVVLSFVFGSYDYGADDADFEGEVLEINVEAFRYGYSPDVIRVKQGDNVRLIIDNSDGIHGMRIPMLLKDGIDSIEFVAKNKGEFIWYCNNNCGVGHADMSGILIVE